ncbi:MAG: DinB family protein [Gemmatimonadota bacterium]
MTEDGDALTRLFIERSRYYLGLEYPLKIRRALEVIPPERIWWRPHEGSNSAGNLVLHLCGNVRQWVVSGIGGAQDTRTRDAEFARRDGPAAADLLAHLDATLTDVVSVLDRISPADLASSRLIQGRTTNVMSALYHVVEHFSAHTGQIVMLAKMYAEPGAVMFYDDARNAAPLFLKDGRSDI